MKTNKRALAIMTAAFMAMTPVAATGLTAFAEGETAAATYDITVDATKAADSDFAAYQIFSGTVSGGKLTGIQWGSGMPSADATKMAAFLSALQKEDAFKVGEGGANVFASLTAESKAEDYSKAIAKLGDKSESANALARILDDVVTSPITDTNAAKNIIGGATSGYYLVKETTPAGEENPISLNLLKVIGKSETIEAKEDLPTLEKEIDEKGGIAANTASVGDVVPYIIKSNVPDMTGYTKYFFVLNDTLSKGLTYNEGSLSVTVGGEDAEYTLTKSDTTDPTSLEIVFKDFYKNYNDNAGDEIVVKYTATVNENADMTQTGNINTAQLTYSNNPNEDAKPDSGNPDKPSSNSPTGQTPQVKTVTYVTQIDLLKTKADGTTPLANATFKLEGYKKTVGTAAGKYYVKDDEGTYYRLKDGSYKLVSEFVAGTDEYYDSTTTKYKEVTLDSNEAKAEKITLTDISNENGEISFAGLGEGTYTITETAAPNGFNKLAQPITVKITASGVSITGCEWDYDLNDPNNATTAGEFVQGDKEGTDSSLPLTVKNTEGSTLPSTGGIGTKLFYLFGGILVAGSGILLITKKRMAKEN